MRQTTLATAGFERYRKPTRREMFLAEMDRVVPWRQLCALIGALPLEQNAESAIQRARHMSLETIAPLSDDPAVSLPALEA